MKYVKQISFTMLIFTIFTLFAQTGVAQWQSVITKTVTPGGTSSSLKELKTGQQWEVEFTVLEGGNLDFYIFNSTNRAKYPTWPYEYYYNVNSTSGKYTLTADADDEYSATCHNSGGTTIKVEVKHMIVGSGGISGYPIITLFGIIAVITFLIIKKRKYQLN
jgi:hypothetical protein